MTGSPVMRSHRLASTHLESARHGRYNLAALSLGLRFLALAVVTGSGLALPASAAWRFQLACGVAAGTVVALLQYAAVRRWGPSVGAWFVPAHVLLWTFLTFAAGGQSSPLFVGFLLEVPLSGALLSRKGCLLAAATGAGAYIVAARLVAAPFDFERAAVFLGFLAVSAVLTWLVIEALERQQRQIEATQAALAARAGSLAEELRLLGDYLSGALVTLDESGRVTSLNPAGAVLLGIDPQAALGRAWQEVLHLDPGTVRSLCATLDEGTPQRAGAALLERPDGRRVAVQAELWVTASPSGRRTHLLLDPVIAGQDDDPLRQLGEAAGCVAHQIKNSIHALLGFVDQIERQNPDGRVGEVSTKQYVSALRTLGELAEDVLGMAGASRPAEQVVALHDLLSSATALGRRADVRVRVTLPERPLYVRASRARLVHALFNLIDNASRASRPGGSVDIRAELEGERVRIDIVDSGPGMPTTHEPRAVPSPEGSGYGLVAVRRFLEAIGGRLSVSPALPTGTCCRVFLPGVAETDRETGSTRHEPARATV